MAPLIQLVIKHLVVVSYCNVTVALHYIAQNPLWHTCSHKSPAPIPNQQSAPYKHPVHTQSGSSLQQEQTLTSLQRTL